MKRKTASGMMTSLLLFGILTLTFNIRSVKAEPLTIIVPDNYPTIQEALDNANEGDTIYVRAGTYYEEVVVRKTVSLVGENMSTTIIDGYLWVIADNTLITEFTIQNGYYGIIVLGGYYGTVIRHNTLTNITGWYGGAIVLEGSFNNVSNNLIKDSIAGIVIDHTPWIGIPPYENSEDYNRIFGNTIINNERGLVLKYSVFNCIYLNNFINNTLQVDYVRETFALPYYNCWADYPLGGNYWSNYTGVDFYSGWGQDQPGGDGIGDTYHPIYKEDGLVGEADLYPFMASISFFNAGSWDQITYYIDIVSNSTVSDFYFDQRTTGPFIRFDVTDKDSTTGFSRVTVPKQILWVENSEWIVLVDGEPITYSVTEDTLFSLTNSTYIYFTYEHSASIVTIIGTHTIEPQPAEVTATMNIHPNTLKLRRGSKRIKGFIELPPEYDVDNIDAYSIMLNGAVPVDEAKIGGNRLMVTFDKAKVQALIIGDMEIPNRSTMITLTIMGRFYDGSLFEGTDTIKVRK